jgi:hypothetical protein
MQWRLASVYIVDSNNSGWIGRRNHPSSVFSAISKQLQLHFFYSLSLRPYTCHSHISLSQLIYDLSKEIRDQLDSCASPGLYLLAIYSCLRNSTMSYR